MYSILLLYTSLICSQCMSPSKMYWKGSTCWKFLVGTIHDRHSQRSKKNVKVPSVIYTGLTNDQALAIGYEHNKKNEKSRLMTFTENVLLFRRKLHGNPDQTLSQTQRAQWKKTMADILGTTVSIQLFIHVHTH